ncbi:MAG: dihydrofolate reductase [Candidatus Kerfeldbacteria bacterium]|nr:dihydrofolate reductase [Candidatus Kerfeldbacteria bacterium]
MKIIMLMAMTADGRIAKARDELVNWTSREDKKYFIELTKEHRALIMGKTTYDTIGKPLPSRLNIVLTREKRKDIPGSLVHIAGTPQEVIAYLKREGYTSAVLAGGANVNGQFIERGLVNEIHLTVEPILFGTGMNIIEGVDVDVHLELVKTEQLNSSGALLLVYKVLAS